MESAAATVFQHVNGLLAAAVDDGLIVRNPARGVKLPSRDGATISVPTVADLAVLTDAAPGWFRPAVVLGAGIGLRHAEAAGLTVDRVLWLERSVEDRSAVAVTATAWAVRSAEDRGE